MSSRTRAASRPRVIAIDLRGSPRLTTLLVTLHAAAAAVPWLLDFPSSAAVACSGVLVAWGTYQSLRHGLFRTRDSLRRLEVARDGRATLRYVGGQAHQARVIGVGMALEHLVVLRCRFVDGGRGAVTVPLCEDACGPDAFLSLKTCVRWGSLAAGAEGRDVPRVTGSA